MHVSLRVVAWACMMSMCWHWVTTKCMRMSYMRVVRDPLAAGEALVLLGVRVRVVMLVVGLVL
jgi:hypothetical protein